MHSSRKSALSAGQRPPWTETPWTETPWTETSQTETSLLDGDPPDRDPPPVDRQTPVKILSCFRLRLRTVMMQFFFFLSAPYNASYIFQ